MLEQLSLQQGTLRLCRYHARADGIDDGIVQGGHTFRGHAQPCCDGGPLPRAVAPRGQGPVSTHGNAGRSGQSSTLVILRLLLFNERMAGLGVRPLDAGS
jgi:hypothetical protein